MRRARAIGVAVAVLVTASVATTPASALLDGPLLTQMIVEEQQAVANLQQIVSTLQSQTQLLTNLATGQSADELAFARGILVGTQATYSSIVGNLQTIGYNLDSVSRNYDAAYPEQSRYRGMDSAQMSAVQTQMRSELLASSQIATRAQTEISDTKTLTDQARQILQSSGSAPGEVAQLQLIVQMLAVVQTQMTMLVHNLTTTGRALVEGGAMSASEQHIAAERKRRNRLNYASRGAPVNVPNHLP
jgi:conjugal transfer/entry exclusion protein